ncbi:hypothetical protein BB559_002090 [Furculomyces boomerangus]|uniref:Uncharacterized protein n=2 Tax=Harpellales TaxID=61421 RepID=A0A2T9YY62_9FUNG|nr:hypothetical protein BB559_002091 [Furculomyces boomerangus]PVU97280.1 hypothetical protein BB559_002090 [Furculomyces boomerangus]PWA02411.1 hypothetical protein BB558_001446 [Smittium angustum]
MARTKKAAVRKRQLKREQELAKLKEDSSTNEIQDSPKNIPSEGNSLEKPLIKDPSPEKVSNDTPILQKKSDVISETISKGISKRRIKRKEGKKLIPKIEEI